MTNITKTNLAQILADHLLVPLSKAGPALDAVFDAIKAEASASNTVRISGFGQFAMKDRAARTARNPHTGAAVEVPAKRVLNFKPSKAS